MNDSERWRYWDLLTKDELTVGDRIRLVRLGAGLSIEETAARQGIRESTQYAKENGNDEVKNVGKFEDAIGIQRGTLLQNSCNLDGANTKSIIFIRKLHSHRGKNGHKAEKDIEKIIRQRISDGTYQDRLPTMRELREEFQYSKQTINLALRPLREEGTIEGKRRAGTFIIPRRP